MAEEGYHIGLSEFFHAVDTWIPDERNGYRLYAIESLNSGPTNEYALVEYSWSNERGDLMAMGRAELVAEEPIKEEVNSAIDDAGNTPFTDRQWNTVVKAYTELTTEVIRDQLYEGVPQLYKGVLYHELDRFGDALRSRIDTIHDKIEKYEEYKDDDERDYYDEYSELDRLGDDQFHNLELVEAGLDWKHSDVVPYAEHCQLAAVLEFEPYEDWEMRAIELLHNSAYANKPEIAKTKALLEEGLNQSEIAEKLGKSPSTVSHQVSEMENINQRVEWHSQNV